MVKDLEISGNHAISDRDIEKRILTNATGWWPFASKKRFDPVSWEADLKRILRLYATKGFYQAEIVRSDVASKPPDGVALTVELREGQATRVGKLDVQGLEGLPAEDRSKVTEDLPLKVGDTFQEGPWAATKEAIESRLRGRGYATVKVDGAALVDVATQEAALTIAVHPGRVYRFGEIQVSTQPGARIPATPIWRETRIAIPEGATFSDQAIEEARRRLVAMGLFGMTSVSAGAHDEKTGLIAVEVRVGEAPFRTLRLGGGARLDQARTEVRLLGEWTHRDFLGGMRRLTARAEAGWAFIPDLYAVATNDQSVAPRNGPIARLRLDLDQPHFFDRTSLRGKITLTGFRTLEQTYAVLGSAIVPGVVWQPRARVSIFPSYHLEANYLSGAPVDSAATAPLTLGCETTTNHCLVWLSYLEQAAIWDRRDNPLEPRRGFYLGLSVQEGGGPLQGDFSYFRLLPDARIFFSFGDEGWLTLSARLKVGELWPTSGVPDDSAVVTRFYAGGPVSMRGFGDRRLSPLLLAPAPGNADIKTTVPIGGNGLIDGSFEARVSVTSSIRLAGFVDYGQVTTGPIGVDAVPHLLWAVGVGLRYLTPIGPIRLDVARRLPFGTLPVLYTTEAGAIVQVPSYPVNTSCFGLFGSQPETPVPDGSCTLQISIGEAF